jgi:hypothetical protein
VGLGGKMDNTLWPIALNQIGKLIPVQNVRFDKLVVFVFVEFFNGYWITRISEFVNIDDLSLFLVQPMANEITADKTGSACNQTSFLHKVPLYFPIHSKVCYHFSKGQCSVFMAILFSGPRTDSLTRQPQ